MTGRSPRPAPSAARSLDALYGHQGGGRPYVTYSFLALCLLVTVPTLFFPKLYDVFGGIEPRRHPWQLVTAAFEHGGPGFHGSVHLALNAFLILECGRPAERLLGHARFLALCALSLLANAVTLSLTEGVNGSSLVIWSWGPVLFVAVMGLLPYLFGSRLNPVATFLMGNLFHFVTTGVGIALAWASAGFRRGRLRQLGSCAP